jgi:hypothetical protein
VTGAAYPDWDAVYRDNVTWVYRLMYGKVGNQPDAEDLTAEVFMTALRPLRVSATVPEVRKYLRMTAPVDVVFTRGAARHASASDRARAIAEVSGPRNQWRNRGFRSKRAGMTSIRFGSVVAGVPAVPAGRRCPARFHAVSHSVTAPRPRR